MSLAGVLHPLGEGHRLDRQQARGEPRRRGGSGPAAPPSEKMLEISRMTSSSRFSRATRAYFSSIDEKPRRTKEASTTGKNARSRPMTP